ncbi:MAG TPA: VOC family protein [Acidimicrobiales bacterium]|nr:VOC family protein [Acidimicrobiales bacterium]
MSGAPRFSGFSITTDRRTEALAFYRLLGFAVQEDKNGNGRSCVDAPNQHFDVDDADAVLSWNPGSRGPGISLGFEVDTPEEVDALVGRLAREGYVVQQAPYDAPWRRRCAVVEDPDGHPIGFMSAGSADPQT